jgi:hypothetical protein
VPTLTKRTLADLKRSGLTQQTIESAGIQDDSDVEVGQLLRDKYHVTGYRLPYFGFDSKELQFYRIKVLSSLNGAKPPKYLQPKASSNHLYLPPGLNSLAAKWAADPVVGLVVTEGEKKALAAIQAGIPCIAVGGVFNWRTHIHTFDRERVRVEDKPSARLVHLDDRGEKAYRTEVASELDAIDWEGREVTLIFDSDAESNTEVQRAAFELANWLGERGAITRQVSLVGRISDRTLKQAGYPAGSKLGLDDVLSLDPAFGDNLLDPEWRSSEGFRPLPSDPLVWVTEQLNAGRTTRPTQERVATFAIHWLDANGTRFMGEDGTYYYFDNTTRELHDFHPGTNLASLRETSFGHLLVEQLGLDPADSSTIGRMIGRYPLGAPLIKPHRVLAQSPDHPDTIYYQLSDADVMRVNADGLELISNGDDDVLFYRGNVAQIDTDLLLAACNEWQQPKVPLWYEALSTLNIDQLAGLSSDESIKLLTCLYYLSPWLNRWRGMMLPLEIAVGEPNSGKSFCANLRKGILTGYPSLSGLPNDFRDWVSTIGSAPAMWICDNLGNVRSDYWHRLNDELARLITDPSPSIEMRQLYTTATTFHVPVSATFAITTVKNPFSAPDVLQRALVYNLNAIPVGKRDPDWYTDRLAHRIKWVAEHLNVLYLFLKLAETKWKPNFQSGYRLVHFEQAVLTMGTVLGWDLRKVVDALPGVVAATVAAYDPVIEAFAAFVEEWDRPRRRVRLREVIDWAEIDPGERFVNLRQLANEISLGKHVRAHTYDIEQSCGITIEKDGATITLILPGGN